jgi:hypothetical protein
MSSLLKIEPICLELVCRFALLGMTAIDHINITILAKG